MSSLYLKELSELDEIPLEDEEMKDMVVKERQRCQQELDNMKVCRIFYNVSGCFCLFCMVSCHSESEFNK